MPTSADILKAAKADCADYFKESCTNGLFPLGDFWQRAVLLARRKHPDAAATATLIRVTSLVDTVKNKNEDHDKFNGILRGVAEPAEGWALGADDFPGSDDSASRATWCSREPSQPITSACSWSTPSRITLSSSAGRQARGRPPSAAKDARRASSPASEPSPSSIEERATTFSSPRSDGSSCSH